MLTFFAPCLIADAATISTGSGYFVYETVALKWHFPIGLLYDIHVLSTDQVPQNSGPPNKPFRLTVHFSPEPSAVTQNLAPTSARALNDAFINSVKEADFLRSGTGKPIMSLSATDSESLWTATRENDLMTFARIHNSLLPNTGQLRNIPLRVYIPSSNAEEPSKAQVRVLQGQFAPVVASTISATASQLRGLSSGQPQTLGTALHSLVPSLFPSRRTPILAQPILHGAQVPMSANLEELARTCCYADGWINIVVALTS